MQPERRVCLLTGAGGRLGSDFCRRYRSRYDIVAVYRRRPPPVAHQDTWHVDPLNSQADLAADRDRVFAVRADLSDCNDLVRVVDTVLAVHGHVDLLVNAAVHARRDRLISLAEGSAWLDNAFYVNASVPIRLAAIIARRHWLWSREENAAMGRNIVNVSSSASIGLVSHAGLGVYSATKVALNMLSCHLAEELGPVGVRVNVLAPTSFPALIPTSAVSDAVVDLDQSGLTGCIVGLDETGTVISDGPAMESMPKQRIGRSGKMDSLYMQENLLTASVDETEKMIIVGREIESMLKQRNGGPGDWISLASGGSCCCCFRFC
jgi:NAD(P)-dependent dehydrogenase (short-subunit alcohol dehydrogenase family)